MMVSLKYAVVERERRFLVIAIPDGVVATRQITDRYLTGTRLRLREVHEGGAIVRKLGDKVRLTDGPAEVACTNLYLDDAEWAALEVLPGSAITKVRHLVERDGWRVAVDEHEDGTLVAEIDNGDHPSVGVPAWLEVVREVTEDESFSGAGLASAGKRSDAE
jgi:CYTH domain-containing protein